MFLKTWVQFFKNHFINCNLDLDGETDFIHLNLMRCVIDNQLWP
jgi:hypothetical protein